jgi:hypothetical protein
MYTFLLRMTDTMASQNIDLSSWDILYNPFGFGSEVGHDIFSLRIGHLRELIL